MERDNEVNIERVTKHDMERDNERDIERDLKHVT
jgi:hypothetical protein